MVDVVFDLFRRVFDELPVPGVNRVRVQVENFLQRQHVIVQVLEDRGPLSKDAVPAQDSIFLLDQKRTI